MFVTITYQCRSEAFRNVKMCDACSREGDGYSNSILMGSFSTSLMSNGLQFKKVATVATFLYEQAILCGAC